VQSAIAFHNKKKTQCEEANSPDTLQGSNGPHVRRSTLASHRRGRGRYLGQRIIQIFWDLEPKKGEKVELPRKPKRRKNKIKVDKKRRKRKKEKEKKRKKKEKYQKERKGKERKGKERKGKEVEERKVEES